MISKFKMKSSIDRSQQLLCDNYDSAISSTTTSYLVYSTAPLGQSIVEEFITNNNNEKKTKRKLSRSSSNEMEVNSKVLLSKSNSTCSNQSNHSSLSFNKSKPIDINQTNLNINLLDCETSNQSNHSNSNIESNDLNIRKRNDLNINQSNSTYEGDHNNIFTDSANSNKCSPIQAPDICINKPNDDIGHHLSENDSGSNNIYDDYLEIGSDYTETPASSTDLKCNKIPKFLRKRWNKMMHKDHIDHNLKATLTNEMQRSVSDTEISRSANKIFDKSLHCNKDNSDSTECPTSLEASPFKVSYSSLQTSPVKAFRARYMSDDPTRDNSIHEVNKKFHSFSFFYCMTEVKGWTIIIVQV